MSAEWVEWTPTRRDELITLVQYGKKTPDEAEAEVRAKGEEPFETQPALPEFDPEKENRWSIPMALAWIAWRDLKLVREQHAGFRSECRYWVFRDWMAPAEGGSSFNKHSGWFLQPWSRTSACRLHFLEQLQRARDELPKTAVSSITEAERRLWDALYRGHIKAAALNSEGRPVEISPPSWNSLKLFEERELDVLKYNSLDHKAAFTNVTFDRAELIASWPATIPCPVAPTGLYEITAEMIEPLARASNTGYVPLCSALHWIMTKGGIRRAPIDDQPLWDTACSELFALIEEDEIELVGRQRGGPLSLPIRGHLFVAIKILLPLSLKLEDIALDAPSHIDCCAYEGEKNWLKSFNDRLYLTGQPGPEWTHLAVRKSQILKRWPRPASRAKPEQACLEWLTAEMLSSPDSRPKLKTEYQEEAKIKFPGLKDRQFKRSWSKALADSNAKWQTPGPTAKRSIQSGN